MKKLSIILGLLLFCSQGVLADEIQDKITQKSLVEENKAVIVNQSKAKDEATCQDLHVKNNWFTIVNQSIYIGDEFKKK